MGANEYLKLISTIRLDLLELLGSGYVIDHCLSEYLEKKKAEREEKDRWIFFGYISDAIKIISENTAKSVNAGESAYYMAKHLIDMLRPETHEEKSGDDIAADVFMRAGLKFADGEEVSS